MPTRTAAATWEGPLTEGKGTMSFGGGAFDGQYSFSSRFENGTGTNPEELIAAAQAGCYSMALSADLGKAGFAPQSVTSNATVHLAKGEDGWRIQLIELKTEASVPEIAEEEFQKIAETTKRNCPVSSALTGTKITVEAKLVG